jgi:hypothetical protein
VTQAKALSESAAETTASTNGIPASQADLPVLGKRLASPHRQLVVAMI